MSDRKRAIETLKENLCAMCAYGSQNMESCDIRSCDNRDAIKALEQEPRWISITERLPEKEEYVLCWLRYGDYMIAKWKYKEWTSEDEVIWVDGNLGTGTFDVVAWMPLPKAYSEVEE